MKKFLKFYVVYAGFAVLAVCLGVVIHMFPTWIAPAILIFGVTPAIIWGIWCNIK